MLHTAPQMMNKRIAIENTALILIECSFCIIYREVSFIKYETVQVTYPLQTTY